MTRRLASIAPHTPAVAVDPPRLHTRPESWFIAAAGGRDAFRAGKPITAAPFPSHDYSWKAWRSGWICASRGEDITLRYQRRPEQRKPHNVDYTEDALSDFRVYAADESIAPDLREAAREILSLIETNARVQARYRRGV